jgi:DNA-binding cell septation regulator SpoVG
MDLITKPVVQSIPSIQSTFVGVDLSISVWSGIKKDKGLSKEVTDSKGAAQGSANVTKYLLGDCKSLHDIQKFVANVRNDHMHMTQDWSTVRVIKNDRFLSHYTPLMQKHQDTFWDMVHPFCDEYDSFVSAAAFGLGGMFNRDDYPTRDTLVSKFRFVVAPVLIATDARTEVQDEAIKYIQEEYAKHYQSMLQAAMGDAWDRLYACLSRVSERLDYGPDNKKIFRDSLVHNAREMIDLLDGFNLTGDDALERARVKLIDAFDGVTADALRDDDTLRGEVKSKVDKLLKETSW